MGFNLSEIKLTASQAAQSIGETVHVVRNWMKDFKSYIPFEKQENGYNLFTQESIDVLMKIKKMYREQNLSTKQIEAILAGADSPIARDEQAAAAVETMGAVQELLEQQRQFNQELLNRLDKQQQQFEKFVQRRDEQIMFVLKEMQESREQKRLMEKSESWWKRLFKG